MVPETAYRREINTDIPSTENLMYTQNTNSTQQRWPPAEPTSANASEQRLQRGQEKRQRAPPKTRTPYLKRLALFNGRKTDESIFKLVLRPFPLLFHPAILWGMFTQGALIGWTVMIGVVLGIIVSTVLSFEEPFGIC